MLINKAFKAIFKTKIKFNKTNMIALKFINAMLHGWLQVNLIFFFKMKFEVQIM